MRYVAVAIVATLIFFSGLIFVALQNKPEVQKVDYPEIRSVVIKDERTVCDKKAEMVLVSNWERICEKRGQDRRCSLSVEDAHQAKLYQGWSLESCNKQAYGI